MHNPFKFGSIVDNDHFINRNSEIEKVKSILKSANHFILISPRRYGKTSLIIKVAKMLKRPYIFLDIQLITSLSDFAAQLLKRVYKKFPLQKVKDSIKNFRIAPAISLNPVTNEIDITYKAASVQSAQTALEDVLNLIEKLGSDKKRPIVILDEFQEIKRIGADADKFLRSVIQHHKNINYVFLGSQESLIRNIFVNKKSPFYHFGYLMPLNKIPPGDFLNFLNSKFRQITNKYENVSSSIIKITGSHPYYTQQLAFTVWEILIKNRNEKDPVQNAVTELVRHHDIDYERLWNTLNRIDMKILIGMSDSDITPLSAEFINKYEAGATSTVYSSIKRMLQNGFLIKSDNDYGFDDPFFKQWIIARRLK